MFPEKYDEIMDTKAEAMARVRDIKERYQLKAEDIALEFYGKEFYTLSQELQVKLYNEAMGRVNDYLREERRLR